MLRFEADLTRIERPYSLFSGWNPRHQLSSAAGDVQMSCVEHDDHDWPMAPPKSWKSQPKMYNPGYL